MKEAWHLIKPYWVSQDKKYAWILLSSLVLLEISSVFVLVRINYCRGDVFNALQQTNSHAFLSASFWFLILILAFVAISVYQTYFKQMLHMRWRLWLTQVYSKQWLQDKTYYQIHLAQSCPDNIDQRLSEDLDKFSEQTLSLSLNALGCILKLLSFLGVLWILSGTLQIGSLPIPGYMVWCAILYASLGSFFTLKLGKTLVGLQVDRQHREANFRFSLVRFRENLEAIALYSGETREIQKFHDYFKPIVQNWRGIIERTRMLSLWTLSYGQFGFFVPYLVAAPQFFSQKIQLGELMQAVDAFGSVQYALGFFVNWYTQIAEWQSTVYRLAEFQKHVQSSQKNQPIQFSDSQSGIKLKNLSLFFPKGQCLLYNLNADFKTGEAVLIQGPNGSGKSTLMKAIAGLWPYASGEIKFQAGSKIFLPQKPYLPLGTLKNILEYPADLKNNADCQHALEQAGLEAWIPHLETGDNWALQMSLGEQQRLSIARVFLHQPDVVFLDESTSALDGSSEAKIYQKLRTYLKHALLISLSHRASLIEFHDRMIKLSV